MKEDHNIDTTEKIDTSAAKGKHPKTISDLLDEMKVSSVGKEEGHKNENGEEFK